MYKILIVEDDLLMAQAIQQEMTMWGHEAEYIKDFRNVLQEFAGYDPHLVLMDITLPFFNGYHWCSEIRKISDVPIIFISSAADNMNIIMAVNMGGDDFVAKPFDLSVLTAKVQAVLRRTYDLAGKVPVLEHRGALLNTGDNTLVYEETRDFMIHEYFRRDLFVKGKEVLTHSQKMKQLRTLHFVFARETDKFDFTIASSKGPIQLPLEYYEPIFNFCKDHRVHSYAEVLDTFADKDVNGYHITEDNVLEVLLNLTLSNTIMPAAAPEDLSPEIIERTKHFNRVILLEEPDSPIKFLVSPITQSGMYFNDVLRALLREYMRDSNVSPEQLKQMLAKRTEGLQVSDEIKKKIDDKQLTMEDMINETVDKFFSDYLPLYKSLEII